MENTCEVSLLMLCGNQTVFFTLQFPGVSKRVTTLNILVANEETSLLCRMKLVVCCHQRSTVLAKQ